jgi:hypothetical protein
MCSYKAHHTASYAACAMKTGSVALYVIQRVDDHNELLRNGKLIDNPECFRRYTGKE